MAERVTIDQLRKQVDWLNKICSEKGLKHTYSIGREYGFTYIWKNSLTHKDCIECTIASGTVRQCSEAVYAVKLVLLD